MERGIKILVIEDDDGMREAIDSLLGAAGFKTVAYASGEALLVAGVACEVACIISDIRLPQMSGLELLTELRSRGATPPMILITAHDAPSVRDEATRRGAAAYLSKPFEGGALLAAIESVVNSRSST